MSKNKKNRMDPNVQKFLEEMEEAKKASQDQLPEGEYQICPGCGEKCGKDLRICPTCGAKIHSTYTPISDKTAAKIRWISGTILIIGFFIFWFFVLNK